MGGYCAAFGPLLPTVNVTKNIVSMYRTPLLEVATKCVFTNTTLVSAYRGAGRPEGALSMERALDYRRGRARHRPFRIAPAQFHQRAKEMPFNAAAGMIYDCGDFPGLFEQALEARRRQRLQAAQARKQKRGKLRGLGLAAMSKPPPRGTSEMGGIRFNDRRHA